MLDKKKVVDALLDIVFFGDPLPGVKELISSAITNTVSRSPKELWEEIFINSFRVAIKEMQPILKRYADTDGEINLNENELAIALNQDLASVVSQKTASDLSDEAFIDSLAKALSMREALVIGGNTLSGADYQQLVWRAVQSASEIFRQTILSNDEAFRFALLRESESTQAIIKEVKSRQDILQDTQNYLVQVFGFNIKLSERVEQKLDQLIAKVSERDDQLESPKELLSEQLSAVIIERAETVPDLPDKLFGRDDLIVTIENLINDKKQILVQGFSGIGKTALVSTIVANHIRSGKGKAIWIRIGHAHADRVFDTLGNALDATKQISSKMGDAKIHAVNELLYQSGVSLLIFDDALDGYSLNHICKAIPKSMPFLVTSRYRYPTFKLVEVNPLSGSASLELLSYFADNDYEDDEYASRLTRALGNLPFSLRIAALTLSVDKITPKALLERIENAPHDLTIPQNFSERGKENIVHLLQASLSDVNIEVQRIFMSFGALFAPYATLELLAIYNAEILSGMSLLKDDEMPNPEKEKLFFELLQNPEPLLKEETFNIKLVTQAVADLHRRGLIDYIPQSKEKSSYYRIHDLAFSYTKTLSKQKDYHKGLDACLIYCEKHHDIESIPLLYPVLENLIEAAKWATKEERFANMDRIVACLTASSRLLFEKELFGVAVDLLVYAVWAARNFGEYEIAAEHSLQLSNAYFSLAQHKSAIASANMALRTFQRVEDKKGEAFAYSELGMSYAEIGEYEQALDYDMRALALLEKLGELKAAEGASHNIGLIYYYQGDYKKALEYFEKGQHKDSGILTNIGLIYSNLGNLDQAIEYHQEALVLAREQGKKSSIGAILANIAHTYQAMKNFEQSLSYYFEALELVQEAGHKTYEANILGDIGATYMFLGQYKAALEYMTQSRMMHHEIGDKRAEAGDLLNIGLVQISLNQRDLAMENLNNAYKIATVIGVMPLISRIEFAIKWAGEQS